MMRGGKRVIVITGVTRGLGAAMADGFAEAGHLVVGCGRAGRTRNSMVQFATVDVSSDEEVKAWAEKTLRDHGPPDLLINNAAIINRNGRLWKTSAAEFERLMAVNVSGTVNVIRHFLPAMVGRKRGVVVNFSSGWGRSTSPDVAPYCASKWAIEGLTQALAQELPEGMAAVALNPGVIHTEMLESCFGSGAKGYPSPAVWARRAVPFILGLSSGDNGQSATVPGVPQD